MYCCELDKVLDQKRVPTTFSDSQTTWPHYNHVFSQLNVKLLPHERFDKNEVVKFELLKKLLKLSLN